MLAAAEALRACQGGYAIAAGGRALITSPAGGGAFTDDPNSASPRKTWRQCWPSPGKWGVQEGWTPHHPVVYGAASDPWSCG